MKINMKKGLSILLVLAVILTGCFNESSIIEKKLELDGLYKIQYMFDKNGESININYPSFILYKTSAIIDNIEYSEINYKVKSIKMKDYILYKINQPIELTENPDKKVFVVSIYSGDDFLLDVIKLGENKLLGFFGNRFFFSELYSDVNDNMFQDFLNDINSNIEYKEKKVKTRTGLFLGVRIESEEDNYDNSFKKDSYETYFIYDDNGEFSIYKTNELIYPKSNGYSKLSIVTSSIGGYNKDEFQVDFSQNMKFDEEMEEEKSNNDKIALPLSYKKAKITYVNPDAFSVELMRFSKDNNIKKDLRIYPLDKDGIKQSLELSDLITSSRDKELNAYIPSTLSSDSSFYSDPKNVGVIRKNGYWSLVNRLLEKGRNGYKYHDINIREHTELLQFQDNMQSITMEEVNKLYSSASDFVSSPDRNISLIFVGDEFRVLSIDESEFKLVDSVKVMNSKMIMNLWYNGIEAEVHHYYVKNSPHWERLK